VGATTIAVPAVALTKSRDRRASAKRTSARTTRANIRIEAKTEVGEITLKEG
jgi:hypothetical protein